MEVSECLRSVTWGFEWFQGVFDGISESFSDGFSGDSGGIWVFSGISEGYRCVTGNRGGFRRFSVTFQGVPKDFQGVSEAVQGVFEGNSGSYRRFLREFRRRYMREFRGFEGSQMRHRRSKGIS